MPLAGRGRSYATVMLSRLIWNTLPEAVVSDEGAAAVRRDENFDGDRGRLVSRPLSGTPRACVGRCFYGRDWRRVSPRGALCDEPRDSDDERAEARDGGE
ncbi:MAG: hypothetical protein LC802_08185 [Acidobacteria bacterium]|nr:hypothetical protein [Acidobacteriota bacterium]